jgi:urease accessory protein
MRTAQRLAAREAMAVDRLVLAYHDRRRCRQRALLASGQEIALLLPRGTVLRAGDRLITDDGLVVAVDAAPEPLSVATCPDPLLLARAAYHLGNRHVPLQIEPGRLSYRHDHVLDHLVQSLGLVVGAAEEPFEPESGAYQGQGSARAHGHDHHHDHEHDHDHGHRQRDDDTSGHHHG